MLEVEHLDVDYRGTVAVEDVSFRVLPGQMVGIIGPNGAGKSTLVKAILGLIPVAGGNVRFRDNHIEKQLGSVAYVPQRSAIDWDYPVKVQDVVMMSRTACIGWFRRPDRKSKEIVKSALSKVGMLEFRYSQIGELSGGQQQRVFLARAIAQQADLFFFDEPFVGIDKKTEDIMLDVFDELKRNGKILILITHDLSSILHQCNSLLLLNKHIIAKGSISEVFTSENLQRAYGDNILFLNRNKKLA